MVVVVVGKAWCIMIPFSSDSESESESASERGSRRRSASSRRIRKLPRRSVENARSPSLQTVKAVQRPPPLHCLYFVRPISSRCRTAASRGALRARALMTPTRAPSHMTRIITAIRRRKGETRVWTDHQRITAEGAEVVWITVKARTSAIPIRQEEERPLRASTFALDSAKSFAGENWKKWPHTTFMI